MSKKPWNIPEEEKKKENIMIRVTEEEKRILTSVCVHYRASYHEFLVEPRMEKARNLIRDNDIPLMEIGDCRLGYRPGLPKYNRRKEKERIGG